MSILDLVFPVTRAPTGTELAQFAVADGFTGDVVPSAVPAPSSAAGSRISDSILDAQQNRITASVGMSIPAVRRAVHVIAGTIGTFGFSLWENGTRKPFGTEQAWLTQPNPQDTLTKTLKRTIQDAIWLDRSVWEILYTYPESPQRPRAVQRVHPDRVDTIPDPDDPDATPTLVVRACARTREPTGQGTVRADRLIYFDFAGTGGLQRFGWDILDLYWNLQAAAVGYAKAPHPKAILKNHGADLTNDEIDVLLTRWEAARTTRSVGYLNDVVDYDTVGWNAQELQLTEARQYAALEVARLFGLPARTLDAPTGDSMTYANVTDARSDVLESLRPWMTPVEQTLSLTDYSGTTNVQGRYVPRAASVRFDADAYTRDAPAVRMATWASAIASGVLTADEARHWEPLASMQPPTGG